jgi:hypothetical protein
MKRIASKDGKEADHDPDAPVPDFYAISRDYPLPELTGFRLRDVSAGSSGHRQDIGVNLHAGSREQDIAALERRRLELLQRFTALPPAAAGPATADPNLAPLLMLLNMQQQQQQQQQLGSTLATLAAGMNQSSLAGTNGFGYSPFGVSSLPQTQSTQLAQLLSQYQQNGALGAALAGPAPSASLAPPPANFAEVFGQNPARQNPLSQVGLLQASTAGLPGLAALLGTSAPSSMAPTGPGNANSSHLLLQHLLSSANGLNGASNGTGLASLMQPQQATASAETSTATRKTSDDIASASTASNQSQPKAPDASQRQATGRSPVPVGLGQPDSQLSGALASLAYLQSQVNASSGASATAGQDTTSGAGTANGASAPPLSNNFLSLFGLNQGSTAAPSQAAPQTLAPTQDDLQRQLLSALAASSANAQAPGSVPMSRELQQLLQQQLQTQLGGQSGLTVSSSNAPPSSQGTEGDE